MDPEFVDDAKLMAITIVFAIGVVQLGRWSWSAVRTLRDGVVHDAKYQTAQLMAGKPPPPPEAFLGAMSHGLVGGPQCG